MKKTAMKRPVVLVVEDDFLIRICAVEMIEAEFDVVEAANADEAIDILEARLDITVVFRHSDAWRYGRPEVGGDD
jgi:CheY-like chemotaxis protein